MKKKKRGSNKQKQGKRKKTFVNSHATLKSFARAMRVEETLMQTLACQLSSTLILVWSRLKVAVCMAKIWGQLQSPPLDQGNNKTILHFKNCNEKFSVWPWNSNHIRPKLEIDQTCVLSRKKYLFSTALNYKTVVVSPPPFIWYKLLRFPCLLLFGVNCCGVPPPFIWYKLLWCPASFYLV